MIVLPHPVSSERLCRSADVAVLCIIATLPWSTSGTSIFLAIWLLLVLPQTDWRQLLRQARRSPSVFAIILFLLTALSVLWSGGVAQEKLNGVGAVAKLAVIPVLILHVSRRGHLAHEALRIFLVSTTALMVLSWVSLMISIPKTALLSMLAPGVPVKDWISQTNFFLIAAFAAAHLACDACTRNHHIRVAGYAGLVAAFIANLMFIHPSRTGLLIIPVLVLLFMVQRIGVRRGTLIGLATSILACLLLWQTSERIRERVESAITEVHRYSANGEATSAGYRLEWYRQTSGLVAHSPIIGYGAGGVRAAMEGMVKAGTLDEKFVTSNPHNQALLTAMQTGLIGVGLLMAMWLSHTIALAGSSLAARIGLAIVIQNIAGGFFNSHLADFTQGWMYVIGVGVTIAAARSQASITANG